MNNVLVYSQRALQCTVEPHDPHTMHSDTVLLSPVPKTFRGQLPAMSDEDSARLTAWVASVQGRRRFAVLVNCDGFATPESAAKLGLACREQNKFRDLVVALGPNTNAFISSYAKRLRTVTIVAAPNRVHLLRDALDGASKCETIIVVLAARRFGKNKPDYGVLEAQLREQFSGFVHSGVQLQSKDPATYCTPNPDGLAALVRAFTHTPNRCVTFRSGSIVTAEAVRALQNAAQICALYAKFAWRETAPLHFPNLTELRLVDTDVPHVFVTDVLRGAPRLGQLKLCFNYENASWLSIDALLRLLRSLPSRDTIHTIRTSYTRIENESEFVDLYASFPNLREFELNWPDDAGVAPETLCAMIERAPPNLNELMIADSISIIAERDEETGRRMRREREEMVPKVFNALLRSRSTPFLDWCEFGIDVARLRSAKRQMMASFGFAFGQAGGATTTRNSAFVRFARRDGDHAICTRVAQWVISQQ